MRKLILALAAGALLALPSLGCTAETPAADKTFGERVRAYLLDHPEVIQEAMTALQAREDARAAAAARTAIAANRKALQADPRDPVAGNPAGVVTVTEFFDYRCPYCKVAGAKIQAFIARHPEVRFVFKEFPILSPESDRAARLALAAQRQGKYLPVHLAFLASPVLNAQATEAVLKREGVDVAKAQADAASPSIDKQVTESQALARTLGVTGTPAFVVGDKIVNGWAPEELDAEIAAVRKAARPAG